MRTLTYRGDRPRTVAPAGGRTFTVQPGASFEADDELAKSLLAQKWFTEPKKKQTKKKTGG